MPNKETGFRGISLKTELVNAIEELIKDFPVYRGVPDFVSEAIRLRMEQLRKDKQKEAS